MHTINIQRPVTCEDLACALGVRNYELSGFLIKREIFLAPLEVIDDDSALAFARANNIEIHFLDGEDPPDHLPVREPIDGGTPDLQGSSNYPTPNENEADTENTD